MKSKTITALRLLEKETKAVHGTEVFIVGGYVRDLLRRKKNKDLDIVVRNISLAASKQFLKKHGKVKDLKIHNINGKKTVNILTFKAHGDQLEAQIALVQGEQKGKKPGTASLKQDAKNRDFTINAMYLPIGAITPKRVIDYVGGKNDITARQILSVGDAAGRFRQSPIRILRAFSMSARMGYKINNHVKHAIVDCAKLLHNVPAEPIRHELEEILTSQKPSVQLKLMHQLGVLNVIMPELAACHGCAQDKRHHKYDVFTHLIYTCDNIENNLILRLAGLLHDIGKPPAKRKEDDKITFYKHEVIGARIAGAILRRLKFDNETIEQVTHLIRMHMYHYTREYTDAGVRKFITKAGIEEKHLTDIENFPLFKLRSAERLGNGYKTVAVTPRQKDFQERIIKIFQESTGFTVKDLAVNGNIIMRVFGLKASPEIGNLLRYLVELIIENPKLNEERLLLHCALDYLLDKKEDK